MKIISQAELSMLDLKVAGNLRQGSRNLVKEELDKLEIGRTLLIEKEDWDRKSPPPSCINGWYKGHGIKLFSSRTLKNEEGWVVTRIR